MKMEQLKKISVTAMFIAVSFLMTFVLRFQVSFLTFDFKDAVLAIVSLLFGPIYGVISAAIVAFLEFLFISSTGVYGLIMNFISSGAFVLICGCVYKAKRDFAGAILSVILSVIGVTAIMMLANIFITPFYMGAQRSDVIALIPTLLLPFNLAKSIINSAALLIIYKPLTTALKKSKLISSESSDYKLSIKSIILTVVSIVIIIITVIFLIKNMGGVFFWHK